ncbi:MAG TPA: LolA-related protein [Usitatibacter sp.]|nr:LolA-related protein [Usitatibacter sp.]
MRRALIRAAMLAAMAAAHAATAAAPLSLDALMDMLRREKPATVRFNETREMALLDRPLESSGELTFTPPDRLEKRTTSPGSERLVVEGDSLVMERAGRRQVASLRQWPQVAAMLEGIRATLAGDGSRLEQVYKVTLDGDAGAWRLDLVPRDAEVAKVVARVTLGGVQGSVRRVEIDQADGDRSLLQIAPPGR